MALSLKSFAYFCNMKYLPCSCLFILLLFCSFTSAGQKKETYTAKNGFTFTVGDTITLGVGSDPDGAFQYIYSGLAKTIFATLSEEEGYDPRLPEYYAGAKLVSHKIKVQDSETILVVRTEEYGNYNVAVEKAISSCEIAYCRPGGYLSQEEFEKLVLIYRAFLAGEISEERFHILRDELTGGVKP
jgi:hypothetical protein